MDRVERSAWHKLDLKYYFDAGGLSHVFADDASLLKESSLIAPPALPWANAMDLYGVTHLIFHFTDFGRRVLPQVSSFDPGGLDAYVALAMSMCLAERDLDLTCELLMSRLCLGCPIDLVDHAAATALCQSQHASGFIPDRRWLAGLTPVADESPADTEFFAVYHPTLVTLFLIACDMDRTAGQGRPL